MLNVMLIFKVVQYNMHNLIILGYTMLSIFNELKNIIHQSFLFNSVPNISGIDFMWV